MEITAPPSTRAWLTQRANQLRTDIEETRRELAEKERELAWCEEGFQFAHLDARSDHSPIRPAATANGTEPVPVPSTLKAAIHHLMRAEPTRRWTAPEVVKRLDEVDRLPGAKSAKQMVRNRLMGLVEDGEIGKDGLTFYLETEPRRSKLIE